MPGESLLDEVNDADASQSESSESDPEEDKTQVSAIFDHLENPRHTSLLENPEFEKIRNFDPVNNPVDKMILEKVISESRAASKRILSNRVFTREQTAVQMRFSQQQKIFYSDTSLNTREDDHDQRAQPGYSRQENTGSVIDDDDPGERLL